MKTKEVQDKLLDILCDYFGVLESLEMSNNIITRYKTEGQTIFHVKINSFEEVEIVLKGEYCNEK